ncbi:hypothetical protein HDU87_008325 [Geranomyces variabilis]|uniref:Uncharacterized protein n=1 Tax=Geranomyces variabilis TaxID=109894 RepID=A0AAD5XMQ4_9FUNG|nr:hypothetical protein HDU87_008325 [Geranomyces variabilis]
MPTLTRRKTRSSTSDDHMDIVRESLADVYIFNDLEVLEPVSKGLELDDDDGEAEILALAAVPVASQAAS